MDKITNSLDWSLVRSFLAVAESGSLSGAAQALNQSQPTMGRHIKQLESDMALQLFERQPRGLRLTEAGENLLEPARAMRAAFAQIALRAAGQDAALSGTVRITASVIVAHFVLPPMLAKMRAEEPDIQIELAPTDSSENLLFREADIAIRMYRSTQLDVVTKHVADTPLGIYGAQDYLQRKGVPQRLEDLTEHDLIGYDRDERIIKGMHAMGWPVHRNWFGLRCDDQAAYWQLVRAGCGLGFSQVLIGEADPLVTRVLPDTDLSSLPVWLAAPEAMRHTPRIRRVWEMLEAELSAALN